MDVIDVQQPIVKGIRRTGEGARCLVNEMRRLKE